MRSPCRHIAVTAVTAAIAVASAYVHRPNFISQRRFVRDARSSKVAVSHDPFQDEWDPNQSPMLRAQSVAKFCFEIGCTIQAYQGTIEKLKRRKRDLTNQMLIVEDELRRLDYWKHGRHAIPRIFDSIGIQPFAVSWWSLLPKSLLQGHEEANRSSGETRTDTISILQDRRQKLSDRALDIQNLLATLEVMEYTDPANTRELAEQYRRVAQAERINIFATSTFWALSKQPQPPRLPPTMKQFMDQFRGDHQSGAMADSYKDDDVAEEYTHEWFARKRVSTYPFSTATASKRLTNKHDKTRGFPYPFSGNTNSTSTLR